MTTYYTGDGVVAGDEVRYTGCSGTDRQGRDYPGDRCNGVVVDVGDVIVVDVLYRKSTTVAKRTNRTYIVSTVYVNPADVANPKRRALELLSRVATSSITKEVQRCKGC